MNFHCPNCKLTGSIDDARVPEQGLYAGCPHCKTRFLIKKEVSPDLAPGQPDPTRPAQGRSLAEPSIAVREAVSGLDSETPRPRAVGGSKMIWAAALLLVLIAGIIAAIAIPKSPGTGAKDPNAAAMYEIRSAKMLVDHYCIVNGVLPETLEQADYHHPQLIDIRFTERSGYRYTIVAAHRYGDTEYALTGDSPDVLSRSKGDTGAFRTIVHEEAR